MGDFVSEWEQTYLAASGDENDLAFWNGSEWIQTPKEPIDASFKAARRYQDPDEGLGDWVKLTRPKLDEFIAAKTRKAQSGHAASDLEPVPSVRGLLYRPTLDPYEIRVLEVLPGAFEASIEGRLHHVSVEFDFGVYREDPIGARVSSHTTPGLRYSRKACFGVSLDEGCPVCYTALSYTWGAAIFPCMVTIDRHSKYITESLDAAIRHLRHAEHSIMLWIDQICIDQDHQKDKESQIKLMESIYQRAWNTVIWLGDEPENGAFGALKGLHEACQYRDDDLFEEEREYLRHPRNEDPDTFNRLQSLFNRPWFQRTWIVQEAILSQRSFIMSGFSAVDFADFSAHCDTIKTLGLFRSPDETANVSAMPQPSGDQVAAQLWIRRVSHNQFQWKARLITALVDTRYAQASNVLDKVYGVLGVCESTVVPDYNITKAELFRKVAVEAMRPGSEDVVRHREKGEDTVALYQPAVLEVLCSVDHDAEETMLPSWVPDWSKPRFTTSLGYSTSAFNCYGASFKTDGLVRLGSDECYLSVPAIVVDRIESLSHAVANAELNADKPREHSDFRSSIEFAKSLSPFQDSQVNTFATFAATIVAGKDGSARQKPPAEYMEIISLLCDQTMGESPCFPDQTYTPRQVKGHFTLEHLRKRKVGRTFQDLRKAYRAAMLNRRLCWSGKGHLGLVPRYARQGDLLCIVPGSAVPFAVREKSAGEYGLVGECYVHHLMDGSVASAKAAEIRHLKIT